MSKHVTVEELEEHLRDRLEDVRNGESARVVDGTKTIAVIEPPSTPRLNVVRHNPALRLQDFKPRGPVRNTGAVEWLIGERERERSGKKQS